MPMEHQLTRQELVWIQTLARQAMNAAENADDLKDLGYLVNLYVENMKGIDKKIGEILRTNAKRVSIR